MRSLGGKKLFQMAISPVFFLLPNLSHVMQGGFLSGGRMTKPLGTSPTSLLPTEVRREATTSNVSGKVKAHFASLQYVRHRKVEKSAHEYLFLKQ